MPPLFRCVFIVVASLVTAVRANAFPLIYTLVGVTFSDGATASGTFTYDADTGVYSNINISTTTATVRSGATYTMKGASVFSAPYEVPLVTTNQGDLTGKPFFGLGFTTFLTDAGGVVTVTGSEASCSNSVCDNVMGPTRYITAGVAVADAPNELLQSSWWFWYVYPPVPTQTNL